MYQVTGEAMTTERPINSRKSRLRSDTIFTAPAPRILRMLISLKNIAPHYCARLCDSVRISCADPFHVRLTQSLPSHYRGMGLFHLSALANFVGPASPRSASFVTFALLGYPTK